MKNLLDHGTRALSIPPKMAFVDQLEKQAIYLHPQSRRGFDPMAF